MIIGHILDKDASHFLRIKLTRANIPEPTPWNRCRAPHSQHHQRLQPPATSLKHCPEPWT